MEACIHNTVLDSCTRLNMHMQLASNKHYHLTVLIFCRNSVAWSNGDSTEPAAELWIPPVLHGATTGADEGHTGCSSTVC